MSSPTTHTLRFGVLGECTKIRGDIQFQTTEPEDAAIAAAGQFHQLLEQQIRDVFRPERVAERAMLYDKESGMLVQTNENKHLFA
jgi:hypothetical protein